MSICLSGINPFSYMPVSRRGQTTKVKFHDPNHIWLKVLSVNRVPSTFIDIFLQIQIKDFQQVLGSGYTFIDVLSPNKISQKCVVPQHIPYGKSIYQNQDTS